MTDIGDRAGQRVTGSEASQALRSSAPALGITRRGVSAGSGIFGWSVAQLCCHVVYAGDRHRPFKRRSTAVSVSVG
ncbi:hypothetical protein CSUI_006963 [Cystoisospora suis]|uniref:Uncharacterized protein n=1 Tax=Cystoisospora suis TaxID=483139 RepID=A0A2C6KFD5_9APIC|nr:hypothetical protein CSUI_006963 [Cystoisospora suis]